MMGEAKILSEQELKTIRARALPLLNANREDLGELTADLAQDNARLIGHIEVVMTEWGKFAFETGVATGEYLCGQNNLIEDMKSLLETARAALLPLANAEPLSQVKCARAADVVSFIESLLKKDQS